MDILYVLNQLVSYYASTRGGGHTTLMKEGTNNYVGQKHVLLMDQAHGENTGIPKDERVTLGSLGRLCGTKSPLAVDNFVLSQIFLISSLKLEQHEEVVTKLKREANYERIMKESAVDEIKKMRKHPIKTFFKTIFGLWQH